MIRTYLITVLLSLIPISELRGSIPYGNFYHNLFEKTVTRARNKVGEKVRKYGLLGLMLFVAIPLPITGAWTGTIGAWVLGLDRKRSILFIILGVLTAGIIVTTVVYTGAGIASLFTKKVDI